MNCAALRPSPVQPAPRRGALSGPLAAPGPRRPAVATRARYGGGRRWFDDAAWGGGGGEGGFSWEAALDGGSLPDDDAVTTFFCADGNVVRLGGAPRHALQAAERRGARRGGSLDPLPTPEEQGLCIGSLFSICATNGVDAARRLHLLGFCQSTEQLYERVEECVLRRGGEVWETRRQLSSGLHERLHMRVAMPLLFGVPPEHERLRSGIQHGGGIIEKVEYTWLII